MNAAAGRLELMLTELRLPTIKRLAADVCAQSDREGWPGQRLLAALVDDEKGILKTKHQQPSTTTTPRPHRPG